MRTDDLIRSLVRSTAKAVVRRKLDVGIEIDEQSRTVYHIHLRVGGKRRGRWCITTWADSNQGYIRFIRKVDGEWSTYAGGAYRWAKLPKGADWPDDPETRRVGRAIRDLNRVIEKRWGTKRQSIEYGLQRLRKGIDRIGR